jgi:chaperonin GroEL
MQVEAFLTTECVIVEKKEEKPMMATPGMGGMEGMM